MTPIMGFGRILVVVGLAFVIMGGIIYLVRKLGMTRIPGSISINIPGETLYIPIIGSIVLSILLSIILNIIIRFLNR